MKKSEKKSLLSKSFKRLPCECASFDASIVYDAPCSKCGLSWHSRIQAEIPQPQTQE